MTDTLRKTDFETLLVTLQEQQDRKVDLVLPATSLCFGGGNLRVLRSDLEPELSADGVKSPVQVYAPNEVFDEGVADRLKNNGVGVPRAFLRSLREQDWTDMIDGTLNALIHGKIVKDARVGVVTGDMLVRSPLDKSVMVRALKDATRARTRPRTCPGSRTGPPPSAGTRRTWTGTGSWLTIPSRWTGTARRWLRVWEGRHGPATSFGLLPPRYHESARSAVYVVYSYGTPIAWATENEDQGPGEDPLVFHLPDVGYSSTTGQQQYAVREAWAAALKRQGAYRRHSGRQREIVRVPPNAELYGAPRRLRSGGLDGALPEDGALDVPRTSAYAGVSEDGAHMGGPVYPSRDTGRGYQHPSHP